MLNFIAGSVRCASFFIGAIILIALLLLAESLLPSAIQTALGYIAVFAVAVAVVVLLNWVFSTPQK